MRAPPVRVADTEERLAVARLLDGANLDTDPEAVADRLARGHVLVVDDPPAGALLAEPRGRDADAGAHNGAVAVRRARRDQGLGSALVRAAADRWGRLTADCDRGVEAFYESVGFAIEERADGRLWGVREARD